MGVFRLVNTAGLGFVVQQRAKEQAVFHAPHRKFPQALRQYR